MRYHSERDLLQEFYISFTKTDKLWADWITWQLKTVDILAKISSPLDSQEGKNFALKIPEILQQFGHILAILSPDYLYALDEELDWALLLQQEAQKTGGLIVPVHVRECRYELRHVLGAIHYIDLVGQNELEARHTLLAIVQENNQPSGAPISFDILKDTMQRKRLQSRLSALKQRDGFPEQAGSFAPYLGHLPYQRNDFFTNREDILTSLYQSFPSDSSTVFPQPVALSGLGGIGKTQIALEYAHRYKNRYRNVFWAKATSRASLVSDFVAIAALLNLSERNRKNQNEIVAAVKDWLQVNSEWLLILDDVEDLEATNDFIPPGSRGHILLTTRMQALGTIAQHIPVSKLSTEEAATFLLRRTHTIAKDADIDMAPLENRTLAKDIALQMDGLPLALDQAGAYIEERHWSLSAYKNYYAQHLIELLRKRGDSPFSHDTSVIATWSISFERLAKTHAAASQLLCFCAFLAVDQIPEEIITSGHALLGSALDYVARNPFALDNAIDELRKFSLIARNPRTRTLHVHGLVQAVIRTALQEKMQDVIQSDEEPHVWAERVIRAINHVFPKAAYKNWSECEKYIAHAMACTDLIEQWQTEFPEDAQKLEFPEAARLLHEAGSYLLDRVQYRQALRLYTLALGIRKKLSNPDDLATSYNDLGWLHRTLSEYEAARPLFDQALQIRKHRSQQALAETLNDLAWLDYNEGRYIEAEDHNQRALAIRESLDVDDVGLASSLNNLAWIHYILGKYDEAKSEYSQALAIRRRIEPNHPYTATILDNLARLHRKLDEYKEAEKLFKDALEIREQALGENHPDVAHSYDGLGFLYYRLGKYDLAAEYYERALAIHRRAWQSPHPHVSQILTNQARLAYAQGHYTQAKELYQQALAIREGRREHEHPDVAHILSHLARLYRRLAEYDEAERLHQRALAIRKKVFQGTQHPDVANILNDMGGLRLAQGDYKEAEQLYFQALAIREEILGVNHLEVAQTLTNLVRLYRILARYDEAKQHGNRAYSIWSQTLGPQHHYLAAILNNLGEVYQAQGENIQAEKAYQKALEIQENVLGSNHPDIALTLNHLADISVISGRYAQAQELLGRAIAIRTRTLGPEHPYLAYSLEILAEIYRLQHRFSEAFSLLDRVIALRTNRLGPNHPDVAASLYQRAELCYEEREYMRAATFYQRALTIREQIFGPEHPDVVAIRQRLRDISETKDQ